MHAYVNKNKNLLQSYSHHDIYTLYLQLKVSRPLLPQSLIHAITSTQYVLSENYVVMYLSRTLQPWTNGFNPLLGAIFQ